MNIDAIQEVLAQKERLLLELEEKNKLILAELKEKTIDRLIEALTKEKEKIKFNESEMDINELSSGEHVFNPDPMLNLFYLYDRKGYNNLSSVLPSFSSPYVSPSYELDYKVIFEMVVPGYESLEIAPSDFEDVSTLNNEIFELKKALELQEEIAKKQNELNAVLGKVELQ